MIKNKVPFNEINWQSPGLGIWEKSFEQNYYRLRLVKYLKSMPPHWCEKGHFGYVIDGEMTIEFTHEAITYRAGDGIFIPNGPGYKHKAIILSEKVLVFFVEVL